METQETRAKLANAIRTLQAQGDTDSINRLVSAYKAKYQTPKTTFDVTQTPESRAVKIANLQAEAQAAQAEAKRANSLGGKLAAFGGALVKNIAGSEVGLGQTLGQSLAAGKVEQDVSSVVQTTTDMLARLRKQIREKELLGGDTTKLKEVYNQLAQSQTPTFEQILPATQKTNIQALGEVGGTALDVLTAGAGSKAARGAKSFTLARGGQGVTQKLATATGFPEVGTIAAQKAGGLFTKQGLKNIGKGAGIGYAYDVTQGVQGFRGEDRTGTRALIPGAGTAFGFTIPAISESVQTVKNLTNPEIKASKIASKRLKALDKLDSYQTVKKAITKGNERGIDVKKIVADTDILVGAVDNTGTINTKGEGGAIQQYTSQFIDGNEAIVSRKS